jgi:deoxyribose-phosphate aldolase
MAQDNPLDADRVAACIEHTLLKPEATPDQIDRLCDEAVEHVLFAVCVNPVYVPRAVQRIDLSALPRTAQTERTAGQTKRIPIVVSVAGFPLGATTAETKADEARRALDHGAREVDMVVHLGALRAGDLQAVRRDIETVARVVHRASPPGLLKVILETAALEADEIILGCRCAAEGEADFVKTSTGFHPAGGATVEHVRLLHRHASPIRVKAAGGIRDARTACAMIEAGASRIGTSSGVAIVRALREANA